MGNKQWTEMEIKKLRELWDNKTTTLGEVTNDFNSFLAHGGFPIRTYGAIAVKTHELKLHLKGLISPNRQQLFLYGLKQPKFRRRELQKETQSYKEDITEIGGVVQG